MSRYVLFFSGLVCLCLCVCARLSVSVLFFARGAREKARQKPPEMDVKKRYIWSDRETEHFIRLIIDMGMTNMLDSKR